MEEQQGSLFNRREDDNRLVQTERAVHELGGEVVAIKQAVASISNTMSRLEQHILHVSSRPVNVTAWISIGFAFLGTIALAAGGIMAFISVTNEPLQAQLDGIIDTFQYHSRQEIERNIEQERFNGMMDERTRWLEKEIDRNHWDSDGRSD